MQGNEACTNQKGTNPSKDAKKEKVQQTARHTRGRRMALTLVPSRDGGLLATSTPGPRRVPGKLQRHLLKLTNCTDNQSGGSWRRARLSHDGSQGSCKMHLLNCTEERICKKRAAWPSVATGPALPTRSTKRELRAPARSTQRELWHTKCKKDKQKGFTGHPSLLGLPSSGSRARSAPDRPTPR